MIYGSGERTILQSLKTQSSWSVPAAHVDEEKQHHKWSSDVHFNAVAFTCVHALTQTYTHTNKYNFIGVPVFVWLHAILNLG